MLLIIGSVGTALAYGDAEAENRYFAAQKLGLNEQDSAEMYFYTLYLSYSGSYDVAQPGLEQCLSQWKHSLLGDLAEYAPWEQYVDILEELDGSSYSMLTIISPYRLCPQVDELQKQLAKHSKVSDVSRSQKVLLVPLAAIDPELEALGGGELVMSLYGSTVTGEYDGWTVYFNPALNETGLEAQLKKWLETGLGMQPESVDLTLKDGRAEDIRVS